MTAEYLRGLLTAYQVLESRDELAVRIVRHLERTVARHPEHGALLRAYVRWSLLPRAKRHQAARAGGSSTVSAGPTPASTLPPTFSPRPPATA
ncbi:hypothetical protein ACFCYC_36980 [Streptomyces sp. NPDC056402]|uniref:hypothetical protein n=1 Tax=Streptomyces sp. NPDC056402 TaxID=3345810 RepID=UPI0035DC9DE6